MLAAVHLRKISWDGISKGDISPFRLEGLPYINKVFLLFVFCYEQYIFKQYFRNIRFFPFQILKEAHASSLVH